MTMITKGMIISSPALNGFVTRTGKRDCGDFPPARCRTRFLVFSIRPTKWIANNELSKT